MHRISHGRDFSCIPLDMLEIIIAYSNLDMAAWGHKYFVGKAFVGPYNFHKFEMSLKCEQYEKAKKKSIPIWKYNVWMRVWAREKF